jgi:hypothetical protein
MSAVTRIRKTIRNPKRILWAIRRRMPGVVHVGRRSTSSVVDFAGSKQIQKRYREDGESAECLRREILARELFSDKPWIIPIGASGAGWISLPLLPDGSRLDHAAVGMDNATRFRVAREALSILLDIHATGHFHGDFHAHNLYWHQDRLLLGDFEKLSAYPAGRAPPFIHSYDLTGIADGVTLPGGPAAAPPMFYGAVTPAEKSLATVLRIPLDLALAGLKSDLKRELRLACEEFQSNSRRHRPRAGLIYGSFTSPYFEVSANEAQRDSFKRLRRFGIDEAVLNGATLLDLGSNIGAMLFEAQNFGPARSVGVEFDGEKVATARRISAFNGYGTVSFEQANVDTLTSEQIGGPSDVVFCLSLIGHVQEPDRLVSLLAEVTRRTLFFEGNRKTNVEDVIRRLKKVGFSRVVSLGVCDDDRLSDNNVRPLLRFER